MGEAQADKLERKTTIAVGVLSIVALLTSMIVAPIVTYKVAIVTLDQRVAVLEAGQKDMSKDLEDLASTINGIAITTARIEERIKQRGNQ